MPATTTDVAQRASTIRARKEGLANRVLALSPDKQRTQPSDKGFSPAELLSHLSETEEFNLGFLRKAPPSSLVGRSAKPGIFYGYVLKTFLAFKRIASPPMLAPKAACQPEADAIRFKQQLDEIDGFLLQTKDMKATFIKMNFLFGTLSVDQYLTFQEAHIAYHEKYFPEV